MSLCDFWWVFRKIIIKNSPDRGGGLNKSLAGRGTRTLAFKRRVTSPPPPCPCMTVVRVAKPVLRNRKEGGRENFPAVPFPVFGNSREYGPNAIPRNREAVFCKEHCKVSYWSVLEYEWKVLVIKVWAEKRRIAGGMGTKWTFGPPCITDQILGLFGQVLGKLCMGYFGVLKSKLAYSPKGNQYINVSETTKSDNTFKQWIFFIEKGLSGYQVVEKCSWSHLLFLSLV